MAENESTQNTETDTTVLVDNLTEQFGNLTELVKEKVAEAVTELIELDGILAEIGKNSNLTSRQLKELGDNAFDIASQYGKSAHDYLTTVQEMFQSGFDNAAEMGELSLLTQTAGNLEADVANQYLIAMDAAYGYQGSIEALTKVLDGQIHLSNLTSLSLQDMAEATLQVAHTASGCGVEIDELSSLITVMLQQTELSGAEAGEALNSILTNLQDTEKVAQVLEATGISITRITNGTESLKTPIELLKELSKVYSRLGEDSILKTSILDNLGGKTDNQAFNSLLMNWSQYEQMLYSYSKGQNSAATAAAEEVSNMQASFNELANTWTDTVENVLNSDMILGAVNSLNLLLTKLNQITDTLGSLGSISLGIGLFTGIKNVG